MPLFREYIDFEFSPAPGATGLDFADFGEDVETLRSHDFPYNTPNEDVLRIVYEVILKPAFQIYDDSGRPQAPGMTLGNVEWSKFKLIPKELRMQSEVTFKGKSQGKSVTAVASTAWSYAEEEKLLAAVAKVGCETPQVVTIAASWSARRRRRQAAPERMMRAAKESFHANGGQINRHMCRCDVPGGGEDNLLEEKVSIETTDGLEKPKELADRVGVSIESIREQLKPTRGVGRREHMGELIPHGQRLRRGSVVAVGAVFPRGLTGEN